MDKVYLVIWWDDNDFSGPEVTVFRSLDDALLLFDNIVEEIKSLNNLDLDEDLEYYLPGVIGEHSGEHVELVEKEVE